MVTSSTGIVAFTGCSWRNWATAASRIMRSTLPASTRRLFGWLEVHAAEGYRPYEEVFETDLSEHTIHLIGQPAAIGNMAALLLFKLATTKPA